MSCLLPSHIAYSHTATQRQYSAALIALQHQALDNSTTNKMIARRLDQLSILTILLSVASAFIAPSSGTGVAKSQTPHDKIFEERGSSRLGVMSSMIESVRGGDSVRNLVVAGRIPWKKFLISKAQLKRIESIMRAETHVVDVVAMVVFSVSGIKSKMRIGRLLCKE